MSNYFVQELVLYRHFMLIDSPIPFELIANPTNFRKDEHGNILNQDLSQITGRDICSRPAGAWRVDCWTLLPEKYHKQNPVFTMLIKYDKDLLEEGEIVDIRYSDIDIGEGVAGVNGQLVAISAGDFRPVVNAIESASSSIVDSVSSVSDKLVSVSDNLVSVSDKLGSVSDKLGSVSQSGSVLNELEQVRTVFKSRASANDSTPWGSLLAFLPHRYIDSVSEFNDFIHSMPVGSSKFFMGHFSGKNSYFHALFRGRVSSRDSGVSYIYLSPCFIKGFCGVSQIYSEILDCFIDYNTSVNSTCYFLTSRGPHGDTSFEFSKVNVCVLG